MLRLDDVISANAPAAMYFVRCSFQVWYSTFTSTPECDASNLLLAAFTAPSQFCCASTCSQTRSVVACAALGDARRAGIALAAAAPSVRAAQTEAAATTRSLIDASSRGRRDARA